MKIEIIFDVLILFILFILNFIIDDYSYYFLIIYICIIIYNIYLLFLIFLNYRQDKKISKIFNFIFLSIILNFFTYYAICDSNPIFFFLTYYIFFPNFFKAILIVLIHTYFLSQYQKKVNFDFLNFLSNNLGNYSNEIKFNSYFYRINNFNISIVIFIKYIFIFK